MNYDKTLILMDTNKTRSTLNGSPRYDSFDFGQDFKELRSFIDRNNLSNNIILAITEMTLKELLVQKKKIYEDDKETMISASSRLRNLENVSIPDFTLPDDSFDCINYINPKVETFLKENKITIIKIEDEKKSSVLDTLIQKAIDYKPPFKRGKDGFKDAVILETFIKSDIKNGCTNVILFTNDNDFSDCEKEIGGINFKIIKSTGDLIDELISIYASKLLEKKYEELSKNQYLITNLKQMIASELDFAVDDINIVSLTEEIIDEPVNLKEKFASLSEDKEYFENMVCFVSKVKIVDSEYTIDVLIDLGSNGIETIQVDSS